MLCSRCVLLLLPPFLFLNHVFSQMVACILAAHVKQVCLFPYLRHSEPHLLLPPAFALLFTPQSSQRFGGLLFRQFRQQDFVGHKVCGFEVVGFKYPAKDCRFALSLGIGENEVL